MGAFSLIVVINLLNRCDMSSLSLFFKRFAYTREKRRLISPNSVKLKHALQKQGKKNILSEVRPSVEEQRERNALQVPEEHLKVTHLYKGRKVKKFDSSKSRVHIDRLILIRSCSKTRRREGKVLLEGKKLITDAILQCKVEPIAFYSWKAENFLEIPASGVTSSVNFFVLEKRDYLRLTLLETPQPVIALCRIPTEMPVLEDAIPLHLICDGVRDPGNLGTLLRCAAAVGCQTVLTLKGTCDPWDPKVVRSSAGANFLIPIMSYLSWTNVQDVVPENTKFLFASSDCGDLSYDEVEWSEESSTDGVVDQLDSWNVLSDEVTSDVDTNLDLNWSDNMTTEVFPEVNDSFYAENEDYDETTPSAASDLMETTVPRTPPSAVALIVSNEGWGMSEAAAEAMDKLGGSQVHVPMSGSVNSLNCSIAASVIMWELRRKFKLFQSKLNEPF